MFEVLILFCLFRHLFEVVLVKSGVILLVGVLGSCCEISNWLRDIGIVLEQFSISFL